MNHELYHGLIVFHLFGFLNTQMFSAGLKLMVVGMLMVLLFLLLMMLFIMLIEFLNRSHTKMEAQRIQQERNCLLYTSPSPRDSGQSRMPSSA